MYEDSWYSIVSDSQSKSEQSTLQSSKHARKVSLLKQPEDADLSHGEILFDLLDGASERKTPPTASVPVRSKSYSDLCDTVGPISNRTISQKNTTDGISLILAEVTSAMDKDAGSDFQWHYAKHEDDILDASHNEYQLYIDQLALSGRHLDGLLEDTTSALDVLAALSESFKTVEAQTTIFQAQCESLIQDQKRLKSLTRDVEKDLQYYSFLEPITRRLNGPGALRFAGDESFVEILINLDTCIEFFAAHPQHREAETYLSRYRSLLARALGLAQLKFSNIVQDTSTTVRQHIASKSLTSARMGVIQSVLSERLDADMESFQIEIRKLKKKHRTSGSPSISHEFSESMISEIAEVARENQRNYLRMRADYIIPKVRQFLDDLVLEFEVKVNDKFLRVARASVTYGLEAIREEYVAFAEILGPTSTQAIFNINEPEHLFFAETVRFDQHVTLITNLVEEFLAPLLADKEVPVLVDAAMFLDNRQMELQTNEEAEEDQQMVTKDVLINMQTKAFQCYLVTSVLERVAAASATRMQAMLQKAIVKHNPLKTDFIDYESADNGPHQTVLPADAELLARLDASSDKGLRLRFTNAYPPIKSAIKCLVYSQEIIVTLNGTKSALDVIPYNVMHESVKAVIRGAAFLHDQHSRAEAALHARLFSLNNLLLLKQVMQKFEISARKTATELNFDHIWTTFHSIRERGLLFDSQSFLDLRTVGNLLPRVVENIYDAERELDGRLRLEINGLTETCAERLRHAQMPGDAVEIMALAFEQVFLEERAVPLQLWNRIHQLAPEVVLAPAGVGMGATATV